MLGNLIFMGWDRGIFHHSYEPFMSHLPGICYLFKYPRIGVYIRIYHGLNHGKQKSGISNSISNTTFCHSESSTHHAYSSMIEDIPKYEDIPKIRYFLALDIQNPVPIIG